MPASPFDPGYLSILGVDPADLRRQQISAALTALGAGIAGGQNWGAGISQGLAGAGQAVGQARQNAVAEGVRGFQLKQQQAEADRQAALETAAKGLKAPSAFDPAVFDLLPADEKFDIWKQAYTQDLKPQSPIVKDFIEGGLTIQKQWNPETKTWDEIGRGPRFAPNQGPAPQRLPLDATVFDADKNAYVYATGPLAGKVAKPGKEPGDTQDSAYEQRKRDAEAYYRDELKDPNWKRLALEYARGTGSEMPAVTEFNPLPDDPDDLEANGYYEHPTYGRVKYLGNGQFEQLD